MTTALTALSLPISLCKSPRFSSRKLQGGREVRVGVFAVLGEVDGGSVEKKSGWHPLFDVEDPRPRVPPSKGKILDMNQALEVARCDIQYCDWRARQDVLTIMLLHDKVVEVLNPLAREYKSIGTVKKELAELQEDLSEAHKQVHISEARVAAALDKLAFMEEMMNERIVQEKNIPESDGRLSLSPSTSASNGIAKPRTARRSLNVSGPVQKYHPRLKNFWYPVAFSDDVKDDNMIPIDCFEEPWVLFRGKDGKVGCVQNTCAHRACPLHLGSVVDGNIQCAYHGWEFSTDGKCQKMPSARLLDIRIRSLPCFEQDGFVWIWPGDAPPAATLPSLKPPPGFVIHAQITMEIPIEHGLLIDNLLDLAHAPFTHTSTFAKGWSVPSLVKFLTPANGLQGHWDPYPIDMEFRPPCMVISTIGIAKPGRLKGQNTSQCSTHLHQLHVCLPSSRKKTRLLYRMSLDFAPFLKYLPFMQILWKHFAEKASHFLFLKETWQCNCVYTYAEYVAEKIKALLLFRGNVGMVIVLTLTHTYTEVLNEDLRLVEGQQERMINGVNVWNWPVPYDKLGVRYRIWRDALERGNKKLPFERSTE